MKIAVDARPLLHPTTGIGRYTWEILKRLTQSQHRWFLYSDRSLSNVFDTDKVVLSNASNKLGFASSVYSQFFFPSWAKRDEIDVFWSPRQHLPLRLGSEIRQVLTVHDLVWQQAPQTMKTFGRSVERVLMPPSLAKADAILTPSISTSRDLQSSYPGTESRVTVTPLAATVTPDKTHQPNYSGYPMFVGTQEPRKNLGTVIRAYRRLAEKGQVNKPLTIVGNAGWGKSDYNDDLLNLKNRGLVDFRGAISDTELRQAYAEASFLISPSLYEGFGLQIADALAFSLPVITSKLSSMPEVAGSAAILVDPLDEVGLSIAIDKLSNDPAFWLHLSQEAKKQSATLSWDQTTDMTMLALLGP